MTRPTPRPTCTVIRPYLPDLVRQCEALLRLLADEISTAATRRPMKARSAPGVVCAMGYVIGRKRRPGGIRTGA